MKLTYERLAELVAEKGKKVMRLLLIALLLCACAPTDPAAHRLDALKSGRAGTL